MLRIFREQKIGDIFYTIQVAETAKIGTPEEVWLPSVFGTSRPMHDAGEETIVQQAIELLKEQGVSPTNPKHFSYRIVRALPLDVLYTSAELGDIAELFPQLKDKGVRKVAGFRVVDKRSGKPAVVEPPTFCSIIGNAKNIGKSVRKETTE